MFFYLLFYIAGHFKNSSFILGLLSFTFGIMGLFLSYKGIQLPYFLDSSFTALPFFYFGYFLRNHTSFLYQKNSSTSTWISFVFIIGTYLIIHFFNYGKLSIIDNTVGGPRGYAQVYPYGIMGTMAVLLLSRIIGKVPILSYIGRYSIIVLCTHVYVLHLMNNCIKGIDSTGLRLLCVFVSTVLICGILIPFFKKYLGYFTAQKDLIKVP